MAIIIKKPGETATVPQGKVAIVCTVDIGALAEAATVDEKVHKALRCAVMQISASMQAHLCTDAQIDADAAALKAARPSGTL